MKMIIRFISMSFLLSISGLIAQENSEDASKDEAAELEAAEENREAEASDEPAGKQILELNKKISDKREAFYTCRKEKKAAKECEKLGEELAALRKERDAKMKEAPGLRRKARKQVGADRIKQKREEKGDFDSKP